MRKALLRPALTGALMLLPAGAGAAETQGAEVEGAEEVQGEGALPGPVTYEVRSWGRLILRWHVKPDGTGEIWKLAEHKDKGLIRKFRLRLDGDALKAFISDVEEARAATRGGVKCAKEIYDLPYGTMTWTYPGANQTYAFDAGCGSEKADEVAEIIGAASTMVEGLARIEPDPYVVEPAQ